MRDRATVRDGATVRDRAAVRDGDGPRQHETATMVVCRVAE